MERPKRQSGVGGRRQTSPASHIYTVSPPGTQATERK